MPALPFSASSRHWKALTLINGEPSSALKARGSEWRALIKVEHGRQGMEGGERSAGHTHQSLSASPSQGDSGGDVVGGDVVGGDDGASSG